MIGKKEFETINRKAMEYVHKHASIGMEQIESKLSKAPRSDSVLGK